MATPPTLPAEFFDGADAPPKTLPADFAFAQPAAPKKLPANFSFSSALPTPEQAVQVATDRATTLVRNLQTLPPLPPPPKPFALMNDAEKGAWTDAEMAKYDATPPKNPISMPKSFDMGPVFGGGARVLRGAPRLYNAMQPGSVDLAVNPDQVAGAASDVLGGAMEAGTMLIPALAEAAPIKTAITLGAATLAGGGTRTLLKKAGAPPGASDLGGDLAAIVAGGLAGKGTGLFDFGKKLELHNAEAARLVEADRAAGARKDTGEELSQRIFGDPTPVAIDGKPHTVELAGTGPEGRPFFQVKTDTGKPVFGGYGENTQAFLRSRGAEGIPAEEVNAGRTTEPAAIVSEARPVQQPASQALPTPAEAADVANARAAELVDNVRKVAPAAEEAAPEAPRQQPANTPNTPVGYTPRGWQFPPQVASPAGNLPAGNIAGAPGSVARRSAPEVVQEPSSVATIPTSDVHADPVRFQFKSNVGQGGVSDEFRDVTTFDPKKSGILSVWNDPEDSKTYVVNGHHRLEMAQRLQAPEVTVRYLDAQDAKEARTQGALINIAEGRGDSVDAAKVFRDSGLDELGLQREGVSLKGQRAAEGLALSNLEPRLFSKVVSGDLPVERGAVIGKGLPDHADQAAFYDALEAREKGGKRATNSQIEEMIRLTPPATTETQESLFGAQEMSRSLIPEKAEVSDYVRRQLGQDKKLFQNVASDAAATKLAGQGNVIQADANAQVAQRTGQAQALYDKLSTSTGHVNDALDLAAAAIAKGEDANVVKQRAYGQIKEGLLQQAASLAGQGQAAAVRTNGNAPGRPGEAGTGQLNRPASAISAAQASGRPRLPSNLAGAAPRYGFGTKLFQVDFDSDVDKAAYITAQKKPSPQDAKYLKFAMDATGLSAAHVRAEGMRIKSALYSQAERGNHGDVLHVPARIAVSPRRAGQRGSFSNKPLDSQAARLAALDKQIADREAGKYTASAANNRGWLKTLRDERANILHFRPDLAVAPPIAAEPAESNYEDKLQGDRLTAQMNAPVTREEQLRKLKRDRTDRQGRMFEPEAEPEKQGNLFGSERGAVSLADLDAYAKKKLGTGGPRMNVSGLGALQDRYVRNLSQLEKVSPVAHSAAVRTASSRVQGTVLLRAAVPQIERAMGEHGPTWPDLKAALVESRLRGLRARWDNLAGQSRIATVSQLRSSFNNGLMGLLENIEGQQGIPQDVSQTAAAMLKNADEGDLPSFTGLRDFLAQTFEDARDQVAHIMPDADFERLRHDPDFARGLEVYKDKVEHHLAESHARNEGVFSDALGPLNTYYPLVPLTAAEQARAAPSVGQATPYRKPRNPSNEFATGLAGEYDLSTEALRDRIARAFKANDKAALIQTLEDEGLLRILGPGERAGEALNIGGVDYQASVIETRGGRQTLKGGRTDYLPAQAAVVPAWLKRELDPILEQKDIRGMSAARLIAAAINWFALSGPVDFAAHSANLLGTAISNTPFLGTSLAGKAMSAPVVKKFAAVVKMMQIDPTSEEAANDLQEMAKLGLLPERYGSVSFSRKVAEQTGGKVERFSFGPALYGPKGLDVRARLLMFRLAREINPEITPLQMYHFVNQMGNYTTSLQGAVERSLKASGWSPFYTAGSTMMRNGVNAFLGTGPMPAGGAGLRIAQQLSGGAVALVALWILLHEAYRGELPWHDHKSKLLSFRALPRDRYSRVGRMLWGDDAEDGYFGLAFFNPLVGRGARALGIAGAYDTAVAGGSAGQTAEAAFVGSVNAALHPVFGPPARAVFAGVFGKETTLTGLRDANSQPGPQFLPAVPRGGSNFPHIGAAFREMNSFYANVGAATGLRSLEPAFNEKGNHWLRVVTDLATPQLFGRPASPLGKGSGLERQHKAEERARARAGR